MASKKTDDTLATVATALFIQLWTTNRHTKTAEFIVQDAITTADMFCRGLEQFQQGKTNADRTPDAIP